MGLESIDGAEEEEEADDEEEIEDCVAAAADDDEDTILILSLFKLVPSLLSLEGHGSIIVLRIPRLVVM